MSVLAKQLPSLLARRKARIWAFGPAALAGALVLVPALCRATWTQRRFAPTFADPALGIAAAILVGLVAWLVLRLVLRLVVARRFADRMQHARTSGRVVECLREEVARGEALGRASVALPLLAVAMLGPYGFLALPAALMGASSALSGWILQGGVAALAGHLVLAAWAVRLGRKQSAAAFGATLPVAMLVAALAVVPGLLLDSALPHTSQFAVTVLGLMIATATATGLHGLLGWPIWLTLMETAIERDRKALAACRIACDGLDAPLRIEDLEPGGARLAEPSAEVEVGIGEPLDDQVDEEVMLRARSA